MAKTPTGKHAAARRRPTEPSRPRRTAARPSGDSGRKPAAKVAVRPAASSKKPAPPPKKTAKAPEPKRPAPAKPAPVAAPTAKRPGKPEPKGALGTRPAATAAARIEEIKALVALGKKKGYLTYDEIMSQTPRGRGVRRAVRRNLPRAGGDGHRGGGRPGAAEGRRRRGDVGGRGVAGGGIGSVPGAGRTHRRSGPHVPPGDGADAAAHPRGRDPDRQAHRGRPQGGGGLRLPRGGRGARDPVYGGAAGAGAAPDRGSAGAERVRGDLRAAGARSAERDQAGDSCAQERAGKGRGDPPAHGEGRSAARRAGAEQVRRPRSPSERPSRPRSCAR